MVRAGWRPEYCTSSMAICESGGEEGTERAELGSRRVGRYGAQDRAADSKDEVEDTNAHAMESCCIKGKDWGRESPHCTVGMADLNEVKAAKC